MKLRLESNPEYSTDSFPATTGRDPVIIFTSSVISYQLTLKSHLCHREGNPQLPEAFEYPWVFPKYISAILMIFQVRHLCSGQWSNQVDDLQRKWAMFTLIASYPGVRNSSQCARDILLVISINYVLFAWDRFKNRLSYCYGVGHHASRLGCKNRAPAPSIFTLASGSMAWWASSLESPLRYSGCPH